MKYAYLVIFFWFISISSEMTPGHPEGCFNTSTSLIPCVTNKAKLPPHSIMNRHQSCGAKGRWEGRRETANRDGKNSPLSLRGSNRRTRVCERACVSVTPPVGPLRTAGGIPKVHSSERNRWTAGKNQTCQPRTKSWCLDKEQPPPPNETNVAISLFPENLAALPALPPTTSQLSGVSSCWHQSDWPVPRRTANSSKRFRRFMMRRSGSWFLTDDQGHFGPEPMGTSACPNTLTHHRSPFVDGLGADAINTQVLRTVLSKRAWIATS